MLLLAGAMSVAAAAFGEREAALARGDGATTQSLGGVDSSLAWFLGAIVVSRAGLYGFDVGAMSLQQQLVDERDRLRNRLPNAIPLERGERVLEINVGYGQRFAFLQQGFESDAKVHQGVRAAGHRDAKLPR